MIFRSHKVLRLEKSEVMNIILSKQQYWKDIKAHKKFYVQ